MESLAHMMKVAASLSRPRFCHNDHECPNTILLCRFPTGDDMLGPALDSGLNSCRQRESTTLVIRTGAFAIFE